MSEKVQFGTTVQPETVEAIERLTKAEGKTKGEIVDIAVAAYDAEPKILAGVELPDDASMVVAIPRDVEMLQDAFGNVIQSCAAFIHPDDIWKAFARTRQAYQKSFPDFKTAERMRAEWQARREVASRPLSYTKKGASLS